MTNNGHAVFGANLDYRDHCRGQLFINKRGVRKTGVIRSTRGVYAQWVAQHASITFNFVGYQFAWAGMNDSGLTLSTMSLPQTVCAAADQRPVVDSGLWMQYVLDTCEIVEDVIATDTAVRNITADHYLVSDLTGASAVIEYLGGEMVVHSGEGLPVAVLTNGTYDTSLRWWLVTRGSGAYGWMDGSQQRFCIAADRVDAFEPAVGASATAFTFDTLDAIAGQRFSEQASQWSIVFDTENLRAYFTTLPHQEIRYVDLGGFWLNCNAPVQMLEIDAPLAGNVTSEFHDYSHGEARDHYYWFINFWIGNLSEAWADSMLRRFEAFPCEVQARLQHRVRSLR